MLARGDEGGALHGHEKWAVECEYSVHLRNGACRVVFFDALCAREGFGMDRELRLAQITCGCADVRFASKNVAILENLSIDHD